MQRSAHPAEHAEEERAYRAHYFDLSHYILQVGSVFGPTERRRSQSAGLIDLDLGGNDITYRQPVKQMSSVVFK
jgi:hypothetical protein